MDDTALNDLEGKTLSRVVVDDGGACLRIEFEDGSYIMPVIDEVTRAVRFEGRGPEGERL